MSVDEFSSVSKNFILDQKTFDRLLIWLDEDRDLAGAKYEDIRIRLIKIFLRKGCNIPEELADETINRVARKLIEIEKDYVGDRALYFYGVASNVFREYVKKRWNTTTVPERWSAAVVSTPDQPEVIEANHRCLEKCLEWLDASNREFIIQYYTEERRARILARKALAAKLGSNVNTLRMRAFRIKSNLQKCVLDCIAVDGSAEELSDV